MHGIHPDTKQLVFRIWKTELRVNTTQYYALGVLAHTLRCPEKRSQELIRVHREVGSTSGLRFSHWHLPRTLHECAPLRTACSTGPQCSVRSVMYLSILFGLVCPTTKVCPFVSLENQTTG